MSRPIVVSNPGRSVGLLDDEAAIADLASSSTLCDACRAIFSADPEPQPSLDLPNYFVHHRSGGLASAAKSGCVICKHLAPAGAGRDQGPPKTQDEEVTHWELGNCERFRGRGGWIPTIPNSTNEDVFLLSLSSPAGVGKLLREEHRSLSFVIAPLEKPIGTSFCPKPDPSKLAGLVRGWVEDCQNQAHWQCARYRGARRLKPRRVLEILDAAVLLRQVPEKGWQNTYITLSHRWTIPEPPKLRRENANKLHTTGIPLASLPQTFQDAAEICRWLGVKYLWIDALCIYQDSAADWEHEAGIMGDIYGGALINIAATDASAACEGMIPRERRVQPLLPVISSLGNAMLPERGAIALHPKRAFICEVSDSMLMERGWVHQEVHIAPATLYMTATQAWWRCSATTCSETYPDGIPLLLEPPLDADHLSILLAGARGEAPTNGGPETTINPDQRGLYLVKWRKIVVAYSGADFTVASDRLIALAGVVSMAAGVLGSYYCGMWYQPSTTKENNHFVYQLFWITGIPGLARRANTLEGHHPLGGRKRKPFIPTWSWASSRSIDYPPINGPQRDHLAHLATPPPIGRLDTFGWPLNAEDATLHLRGVLLPLFVMPHFFNQLGLQAWPRPLGDRPLPSNGRLHGVWAIFDDAQELAEVKEEAERKLGGDEPLRGLFFLVTEYADKSYARLHGMILREQFLPGCDDDDNNGRDDGDGSTVGRQRRRIFSRSGVFFPNQCCGYPEEDPLRDVTAVFNAFQIARYGRAALEAVELRPENRALADAEARLDDIYLC